MLSTPGENCGEVWIIPAQRSATIVFVSGYEGFHGGTVRQLFLIRPTPPIRPEIPGVLVPPARSPERGSPAGWLSRSARALPCSGGTGAAALLPGRPGSTRRPLFRCRTPEFPPR